jgi:ubiquinone/menaquinone biosynthesis C-methylase UbiE
MSETHAHMRAHYAPRAHSYLTSETHVAGADLDQIAAFGAARRPARVLDLGCGGGHVAYLAANFAAEVIACDVTQAMLAVVRETAAARNLANLHTELAAAEALPFADGRFDLVLCRYSAHHWADLDAGLREAHRVLADGGAALFVDTIAPSEAALDSHLQTLELLRDPTHARNYRAEEWLAAIGRAGFTAQSLTRRRIRMDFASWTARTRTTPARIAALREVQHEASKRTQNYFAIEPDGSWMLDTLAIELTKA